MEPKHANVESIVDVAQHFETTVALRPSCAKVFEYLDDFAHFGEHMMSSSWMMAGSAMRYEFDETSGRAQGALVRLVGAFLCLRIVIDERVVERAPPYRKSWETVGNPRMFIMKRYRMGFDVLPRNEGSDLRVFVDYAIPERGFDRLLGRLFGSIYARWCVRSVINGTSAHFGRVPENRVDR